VVSPARAMLGVLVACALLSLPGVALASVVPTSSLDASRVLTVPGSEVEVTGTVTLSASTVDALASAIAAATAGTQSVSIVGTMPVSVADLGGIDAKTPITILVLVTGWAVGRFALA